MSQWFLWLWILCDLLSYLVVGIGMLGPADLIFQTLECCEDCMGIINLSIKQKKYNRTVSLMDINLETPYDLGDNVILELKGSIKKEGGYKPGSFYMKDPACDILNVLMGDIFTQILQSTGSEECPLVAGEHAALDFFFDNRQFNVPQVYGEYKMEANIFKDEELQACLNAYYVLVPKEE